MKRTTVSGLLAIGRWTEARPGVVGALYGVGWVASFAALEINIFSGAAFSARLAIFGPVLYALSSCASGFCRSRTNARTARLMRLLPTDVTFQRSDDGSGSGTIHMGDGRLVGIRIPPNIVAELDEHPELAVPYVFEEVVPAEVRMHFGVPSLADMRAAIEEADDASDH